MVLAHQLWNFWNFRYLQCFWRHVPPNPGKYQKFPKLPKLRVPTPCTYSKTLKKIKAFQTLGLRAGIRSGVEAGEYCGKLCSFVFFWYLHGFGAISFGFSEFFGIYSVSGSLIKAFVEYIITWNDG